MDTKIFNGEISLKYFRIKIYLELKLITECIYIYIYIYIYMCVCVCVCVEEKTIKRSINENI